jgi:Domain of unknown function (DUF4900)
MTRRAPRGERGLVLLSLLSMILVLTALAALVLFLSGKETALSGVRAAGNESLYVAEGGGYSARAALMVYMNAFPQGRSTVDPSLDTTTTAGWYAGGNNALQNPLRLLDYLVIDGQRFTLNATSSTASETFQVNWASGYSNLKLQTTGTPVNTLGPGSYTGTVVLQPNPTADASCSGGGSCAIHQIPNAQNAYEIFYKYTITSDGQVSPRFKRRVTLTGNFSVQLSLQSFALYALFTHVHTTPSGNPIWFTNNTTFSGPVHTNGEFRFAFFPTFTSKVESVNTSAWYNNTGSPLELATTANVQSGTRIDAPLVPPVSDPQSAPPANFTLGAPSVAMPASPFSQQGVAVGRNPTDTTAVTTAQITGAIPELTGSGAVPNGIYVPVTDSANTCRSNIGESMKGGIYVQGDLNSLTMSVAGSTAVYTLVQGSTTTTVTIDRGNNQTTVTSNGWMAPPSGGGCPGVGAGPATRTFVGVPKGWQGPGNPNATMIYVNGNVNALSGTLQQNEQTTIAASNSITITGNVQYQTPPNPSDPTSNPVNVLGLYASGGDIVIGPSAPNNVIIQAVLMAGNMSSGYNSSVNVQNYNSGSPRGSVNLLGGLIEKYYGPFGTFNASTGTQQTGYGRAFTYDTRMSRGFTPPYFPTTGAYGIDRGSMRLDGVKPTWREGTPP